MDWFTNLEQRKRATLFVIFLLLIATLAVTSLRDPVDYDSFWHLRMGQDWVRSGLSPWQDHYSYTYEGAAIMSPPVFFQAGLYGVTQFFGVEAGFKVLLFTCMLLVLVLTALWLKRIRAPVMVYCVILPMLVALLQMRATIRPELLSYAFCILSLMLYDRAKTGLTPKSMLPIALLMLVWTNYHSPIFGYIIFLGLFLDYGWKQLSARAPAAEWVRWLAWGGVVVGVGFLNPGFSHPLLSVLAFSDEWKTLIQEYLSPVMYKNVPPVYILVIMTLATLALLVRQRRWGYLVVVGVLSFHASTMARLVTPAGIVILCIFAHALTAVDLRSAVTSGSRQRRKLLAGIVLLVFLVPLLNDVVTARAFVRQNLTLAGHFPDQMVQYMKDGGKQGRIFNEYELGGYLIYHLAPDSKVYIDGRTDILYPVEHYQRYLSAKKTPEAMRSEVEEFDIDLAILGNTAANARLMNQAGLLKLDYADLRYSLFTRDDPAYPLSGSLWGEPYCWNAQMAPALADERISASINLPPASPVMPFLALVTAYANAEDQGAFLSGAGDSAFWPDPNKRFAGYQALSHGFYEQAEALFKGIQVKDQKDYLAEALAVFRKGDPAQAENLINTALHIRWDNLEFVDVVILEGLLREIQEVQPLTNFEPEYLENLASQVGTSALSASGMRVGAETFCSRPTGT